MSLLYGHMTLINPNNRLQLSNATINLRQQVQLLERSPLEIPHQMVVMVYYVVLSLLANFLVSSYVCATAFKFGHQLQLLARGPLKYLSSCPGDVIIMWSLAFENIHIFSYG